MFNGIKNIKTIKNPFLIFAPFLLLYIILIIIFPTDGMGGDESRYLTYSQYMINGFLPQNEAGFEILGNGPGYSITLIPFVALHLPLIWITIMNAVFYYFSIILLFNTLLKVASFRKALLLSLLWACYYNSYENILLILPETFTAFLICLLIFSLTNAYNTEKSKKYIFLSGFVLGYIALTKPIYGYVILAMILICGSMWVIKRKVPNYRKAIIISLIALATTLPYLVYTYHLTNKIFYWSSLGGNNLYWMSTHFEGEYGSWIPDPKPIQDTVPEDKHYSDLDKYLKSNRNAHISGYSEYVKLNHQKDFDEINKYKGVERDDAYERLALNNIKSHPIKFIQNCLSNAGRMLFNFPFSYKLQSPGTLLRLPLSGTIVVLGLFCLIPSFTNWKKIIFPIRFMLLLAILYLGGSILASAETRMFTVIVPILLFWIGFIIQKTIKINLKW